MNSTATIRAPFPKYWSYFLGGAITFWIALIAIQAAHFFLFASSAVVLFVSSRFFHRSVKVFDLRRPTIPGIWFLCYVSMSWFPSILIFLGVTPEGYSYPIYSGRHLYPFLFATFSVLLTVPIGIWIVNVVKRFSVDEISAFFEAPVNARSIHIRRYLLLITFAVATTLLYFSEVKVFPLVEMLRDPGNFVSLALLREESFVDLNSRFVYAYSVLREALYPFLIAVALGNYICTRRRRWLVLLVVTSLAGLSYASVSIARGPVATILLVVVGIWYLLRSTKITMRQVAIAGGIVLSFPLFVTIWTRETDLPLFEALKLVGIRLFYLPTYVAYVYFEVVPKEVHFLHGATIEKLAMLLGMQSFDMSKYVISTIYPGAPESAGAGGAFFADFYANFGLPGVLVGGVLLGVILQGIQIAILRRQKTVVSVAVYSFMFYAFWMTTSRALSTVLLSTGTVFVLFLWWFLDCSGESRAFSRVQAIQG
jgi:oligosaccharide repeat unit polymerase